MPDHLHAIIAFPREPGMQTTIKNWKKFVAGKHGIELATRFFRSSLTGPSRIGRKNQLHPDESGPQRIVPTTRGLDVGLSAKRSSAAELVGGRPVHMEGTRPTVRATLVRRQSERPIASSVRFGLCLDDVGIGTCIAVKRPGHGSNRTCSQPDQSRLIGSADNQIVIHVTDKNICSSIRLKVTARTADTGPVRSKAAGSQVGSVQCRRRRKRWCWRRCSGSCSGSGCSCCGSRRRCECRSSSRRKRSCSGRRKGRCRCRCKRSCSRRCECRSGSRRKGRRSGRRKRGCRCSVGVNVAVAVGVKVAVAVGVNVAVAVGVNVAVAVGVKVAVAVGVNVAVAVAVAVGVAVAVAVGVGVGVAAAQPGNLNDPTRVAQLAPLVAV